MTTIDKARSFLIKHLGRGHINANETMVMLMADFHESQSQWISVDDRLPICFESGVWDGKRSELVIVKTSKGNIFLARVYSGTMDGRAFSEWYTEDDYELSLIIEWKNI